MLAVLVLVLPAVVEAACGKSNRMSHRDADCLSAWWDNNNHDSYQYNTFHVQNVCPSLGRVVAKVDLRDTTDRTLYLDNGATRSGHTKFPIRWIYCCTDLSTLCKRSDLDRADERASVPDGAAAATGFVPEAAMKDWVAGFGRALAAAHVEHLGAALAAGDLPPQLTLGGTRVGLAPDTGAALPQEDAIAGAGRWQASAVRGSAGPAGSRPGAPAAAATSGRDVLPGSSFLFSGAETGSGRWFGWGMSAPLQFAAAPGPGGAGRLNLLGTGYARDRLAVGMAWSHGWGAGGRGPDGLYGIGTSLHGVHPYVRLALNDRFSIWSAVGFWTGAMVLRGADDGDGSRRWRTGLDMAMAAVGAGGPVLTAADGYSLTAKADAYAIRIASRVVTDPGVGDRTMDAIETYRLRLALDGSRAIDLGPDRSLAASLGVGLTRADGEHGTGTGVGLRAFTRYALAEHAMSVGLDLFEGGREYAFGWRMELAGPAGRDFSLGIQAARREHRPGPRETDSTIDLVVIAVW